MMCDIMPTIAEDGPMMLAGDRDSYASSAGTPGEDAKFEQLMINMLDERDKLVENLRETQVCMINFFFF